MRRQRPKYILANCLSSPVQFDIEDRSQLDAYLRTNGHATANMSLSIERLAGGVSNRTMLVKFGDGRAWVVKQALAKLRVAVDWFSDPERIERECKVFGD